MIVPLQIGDLGSQKLQPTLPTKKPKDIYTKKGDYSSNEEEQSKGKIKDAGYESSGPNNSGDDRDNDSSVEDE